MRPVVDGTPAVRPVVAVLLVMIATGLLLTHQDRWLTLPVAVVGTAVLLVLARRSGLTWQGMGLGRTELVRGLRWGGVVAAVLLGGAALLAVLPLGDAVFADEAMPEQGWEALARIAVIIPLRTVLIEEVAFRGVLWGMLQDRWGARRATFWAAAAFGVWHVPAGLRLVESNAAVSGLVDGGALLHALTVTGVVALVVLLTGAAGVGFSELRRRSGSLAAPMLAHWSLNSAATMVSVLR